MKFCRFQPLEFGVDADGAPAHPEPLFGLLEGSSVRELLGDPLTEWRRAERTWPLDRVRLLAPILPSKIVGVGRNYAEHAAEMSNPLPKEPLIFLKPPSSIIGPEEPIVLTPFTQNVHHEAEIAVVMGKTCSQLADGEPALPYVLGFTCVNDVTARDLQRSDGQWTRAKGFDTFCPMGPVIETEVDLAKSTVAGYVNGERRQFAPVTDLLFSVDFLIHWISRMMTLVPGDVISTGTPSGVGPLRAGDVVEVVVDGVGTLRNPVVAPASVSPPKASRHLSETAKGH
jgi:2-keto-4-pentenoate hydratase/2-oxohepta-3-ene-1,7-dioic acid hydratase in catechol pathway